MTGPQRRNGPWMSSVREPHPRASGGRRCHPGWRGEVPCAPNSFCIGSWRGKYRTNSARRGGCRTSCWFFRKVRRGESKVDGNTGEQTQVNIIHCVVHKTRKGLVPI